MIQRDVFHTLCTFQGKVCKMIIDNGCFENLVSIEMVQKLGLKIALHPNPYQLCRYARVLLKLVNAA